jgi:hypothetical protein
MPMNPEEIADIKADLRVVKDSMIAVSDAQTANTKAQTEVAKQISGLLIEMKERDVRNEYLTIEVKNISAKQVSFEEFANPILTKSKAKQDFKQKIVDAMGTNTVRLICAVLFAGALFLLGVDPTQWKA